MAETINMPKLGFDMAEGTLVRWVKQVGESINKGDVLAEIETDKATVEVESSASGVVLQHIVDQGSVVPVSAPIAVIGEEGEKVDAPAGGGEKPKVEEKKEEPKAEGKPQAETAPPPTQPAEAPVQQAAEPAESGPVKASPLAKRIAREKNLDLSRVQGSGPGGRVVRKDVEAALASGQPPAAGRQPSTPTPVVAGAGDETVPLTRLRQAIARRMVESTTSVPHFFVTHEYRMDSLMAMRKQANAFLPDDEKLSVNDFIIKAVALTLREFPNLNSSYAGDKAIRHGSINIGIAVAVEGGLLTVVTRNTDQQPLRAISADVKRKAAGAREGKVRPDDIEGSTFSISNLGMFDVENFSAIINPPEAGILAVGSAREIPVVENGQIKPGWRMKATLSVDHRVSDGAEAAQFMQKLAEFLENPVRMLV
ncbi:MAG TPA: dihydrolipoamide acetyltransferase family protein [Anaerolineales bacterium]|nr:dihydrolipoamide acetyltransferase family protein [Anaerolineales bacterium]